MYVDFLVPSLPPKHVGPGPELICSYSCRQFDDLGNGAIRARLVKSVITLSSGYTNAGNPKLDCICNCVPECN